MIVSAVIRLLVLLGLSGALRAAGADAPVAAGPGLAVTSPDRALCFTLAEFAALPHRESTVPDPHSGTARHFAGVAVSEVLARVAAPLGPELRGPALGMAVVVRGRDGYSAVFALADFDPAFRSRTIFLADQEDGKPLSANAAPLQLIVPGDKRPARWVRMVVAIEIIGLGKVASSQTTSP